MIINHSSIRCEADAIGVPLRVVERDGKSYTARAMSQAEAEEAVTAHLDAKTEAASNEPSLL